MTNLNNSNDIREEEILDCMMIDALLVKPGKHPEKIRIAENQFMLSATHTY